MTPHEKALLYAPTIVGLTLGLGWFIFDPKGDARRWLRDHLRI